MAEQDAKPSGPDLSQGVAFTDLADGGMLLGHVGDEQVLLARTGAELFAVGASLQPLSRSARRRTAGRRHRALPLASRLLQPAHRRGAGRAGHQCDRLLVGRAARRQGLRQGEAAGAGEACSQAERQGAGQDRDRGRRRGGLRGGRDAAARAVQGQHRHAEQRRCRAGRSSEPFQGLPRGQCARGMGPVARRRLLQGQRHRPAPQGQCREHRCRARTKWRWRMAARSPTTACCWRPARSRCACPFPARGRRRSTRCAAWPTAGRSSSRPSRPSAPW